MKRRYVNVLTALSAQYERLRPELDAPAKWYNFVPPTATAPDTTTIMLYGIIGDPWEGVTASDFARELKAVNTANVDVRINSGGGQIFDGVAIHTALVQHPANVTTYVDGIAASAASFIAMAGNTVRAARNAIMMIHDGEGLTWGDAAAHEESAKLLHLLSDNIADIYAERAGDDATEWRNRMRVGSGNSGTWYTGQTALEAGLVDELVEPSIDDDDLPPLQPANRSTPPPATPPTPAPPSPPAPPAPTDEDRAEEQVHHTSEQDRVWPFLAALLKRA